MSAVAVFVNSQRAVILSDSAIYDYSGIPKAFDQKVFPVDSWNGAITFRGDAHGIGFGMILCERFASFDDFIARSAPVIEHMYRHEVAAVTGDNSRLIEVHAIGWSEIQDRPQAFVLRSPMPDDDAPPFVWRSLDEEDGIFYTRLTALEQWRLSRQGAEPRVDYTSETFDSLKHGIPLLEAMRRETCSPTYTPGAAGKHVVGGEIYLTIVDREGTRQGIIHAWEDDRAGHAICASPFDDDAFPKVVPPDCPYSYERFQGMLRMGAVRPETFELNHARLVELKAEQDAAVLAASGTRRDRRAAKAQARKGGFARA